MDSGVTDLSIGKYYSCGIQNEQVKCWHYTEGYNLEKILPKTIKNIESGATNVSVREWQASEDRPNVCSIQRGALKCWGNNDHGQLGNGTKKESLIPQIVKGMESEVTAMNLGLFYATCAIQKRSLKCWGNNDHGQLGNGIKKESLIPQIVKGMESEVTAMSLGLFYACAIQRGALKCWGNNDHGQLGNGTKKESLIPQIVKGMESGVTYVSTKTNYSCAIQRGALKCWGNNDYGQLGNGTKKESLIPQTVKGMESGVTAVSLGSFNTCSIQKEGLKCWGDNTFGEIGIENKMTDKPESVKGMKSGVTAVGLGSSHHTCIIQRGALKCMGDNNPFKKLIYYGRKPHLIKSLTSGVTHVFLGNYYNCAIQNESLKCWI